MQRIDIRRASRWFYRLGLAALLTTASLLVTPGAAAQAVPYPTELTQMVPATAAIPSAGVTLTLLGRGFAAGQGLESSNPGVQVMAFRVASPTVAMATLRVLPGTAPGPVRLDIYDPLGLGTAWQDIIPHLTLVPSGSITAPLSVQEAAVVFPAPGTLLAPGAPLMARGALVTSGSGAIIGRFLLDGVPFDQFTAVAGGGAPVGVSARVPVPFTGPGTHDLQVEVLSPQHILSGAVRLVGTVESRTALALLAPGEGASASAPPMFRWTFVPGAAGYEVALTPRGAFRPSQTWRTSRSEYSPSPAEWSALGSGRFTWTVRALFPGEVLGAPAPARALFVAGGTVELRLAPAAPGPRPDTLLISWEGGPEGTLYRLEFSRDGRLLFDAMTRQPQYLLRLPASEGVVDVAVTALGPDGLPLGPPVRGTTAGPRGERRGEPAVQFAAGPVTVTSVGPAEGASVEATRPPISARWQGSVDPGDVVLFLDNTDVTAMAALQPGGLTYTPVLALTPGSHSVRLSLGAAEHAWHFTVSAPGAPAAQGEGSALGTGEPPAAEASSKRGAATGSWTLQAAGTFTGVSGSAPGEEETFRATLTGQSDLGGGGLFFKSTTDASWRHDFQSPGRTLNESRSWLFSGGTRGDGWSLDGQAGYGAAEILEGSQFLSPGLTRGGAQLRAETPAGEFGAYASFDDHMPALGSSTGLGEQTVRAASYALPLPSKDYSVRLMGLWSDRETTAYSAGGSGRVLGVLGTFRFSPAIALSLEAARSSQTPDAGASTQGNGYRMGLSGTAAGFTYALNLRRVEGEFGNPANPGYNAGGVPDRQGGELNLSRAFGKVAAVFDCQYAKDGVGGGGLVPSGRHRQAHLGLARPLGSFATLAFDLNSARDRGGEDLSKGLPGVRRNQDGLTLASTQRAGQLFFSESYTGQRVRDDANPASAVDLDSLVFSAGGNFTTNLGLAATLSLSRTDMPFGVGRTDLTVFSLSPSWTLPDAHLTFLPQFMYTKTESALGTTDASTRQYGLTLQWSPTFWRSFMALQGSAMWTHATGISMGPVSGTEHRYTLSVSFRWNGGSGALDRRFNPAGAPAGMGLFTAPVRPASSLYPYSPYSPYPSYPGFLPASPLFAPGL